ncbi:hypothetical protein C8J56DRAFT_511114 [Mycena floridula]|nr:hypothetical protein C8J56DRAFT_511114 [Mycena floridula]
MEDGVFIVNAWEPLVDAREISRIGQCGAISAVPVLVAIQKAGGPCWYGSLMPFSLSILRFDILYFCNRVFSTIKQPYRACESWPGDIARESTPETKDFHRDLRRSIRSRISPIHDARQACNDSFAKGFQQAREREAVKQSSKSKAALGREEVSE